MKKIILAGVFSMLASSAFAEWVGSVKVDPMTDVETYMVYGLSEDRKFDFMFECVKDEKYEVYVMNKSRFTPKTGMVRVMNIRIDKKEIFEHEPRHGGDSLAWDTDYDVVVDFAKKLEGSKTVALEWNNTVDVINMEGYDTYIKKFLNNCE